MEDLLEWNKLDPVDNHEIHRNNLCHKFVQGNRNPYIDYPQWADIAFGNSSYGIDLSNDNGLEKNLINNLKQIWKSNNYSIIILFIILIILFILIII